MNGSKARYNLTFCGSEIDSTYTINILIILTYAVV